MDNKMRNGIRFMCVPKVICWYLRWFEISVGHVDGLHWQPCVRLHANASYHSVNNPLDSARGSSITKVPVKMQPSITDYQLSTDRHPALDHTRRGAKRKHNHAPSHLYLSSR